jgi:hypothetical protein
MTTSNGDKGRIVEHVEGAVSSVNPRGVKLAGQADYINFSKYADPPIAPPRRGQHVTLGLDADGYVRQLQVLDQANSAGAPASDRERKIRRMSALRSAAAFCGGKALNTEVSTADVLKVAGAFEHWLQRGD